MWGVSVGFVMCGCVSRFCNVGVCVCVEFVKCGCLCLGFLMCRCGNEWVF